MGKRCQASALQDAAATISDGLSLLVLAPFLLQGYACGGPKSPVRRCDPDGLIVLPSIGGADFGVRRLDAALVSTSGGALRFVRWESAVKPAHSMTLTRRFQMASRSLSQRHSYFRGTPLVGRKVQCVGVTPMVHRSAEPILECGGSTPLWLPPAAGFCALSDGKALSSQRTPGRCRDDFRWPLAPCLGAIPTSGVRLRWTEKSTA